MDRNKSFKLSQCENKFKPAELLTFLSPSWAHVTHRVLASHRIDVRYYLENISYTRRLMWAAAALCYLESRVTGEHVDDNRIRTGIIQ